VDGSLFFFILLPRNEKTKQGKVGRQNFFLLHSVVPTDFIRSFNLFETRSEKTKITKMRFFRIDTQWTFLIFFFLPPFSESFLCSTVMAPEQIYRGDAAMTLRKK